MVPYLAELVLDVLHDVARQVDHLAEGRLGCVACLGSRENDLVLEVQSHSYYVLMVNLSSGIGFLSSDVIFGYFLLRKYVFSVRLGGG